MRVLLGVALALFFSTPSAFCEDVDFDKLAQRERTELAQCMTDSLKVIEKHRLAGRLIGIWNIFDATCGMEMERAKSAMEFGLKDELLKKVMPDQMIFHMVEKASELYDKSPQSPCSGTGCALGDYRTCLIRQMPASIKSRRKPIDFENQSQQRCEDSESSLRAALTDDFDEVQRHHFAGGLNHQMSDVIRNIIVETRRAVVVLYAEDLVRVQPGRKSCRPEMCGASPCIALSKEPTEYECVIDQ